MSPKISPDTDWLIDWQSGVKCIGLGLLCSEDGDSKNLRNVGNTAHIHAVSSRNKIGNVYSLAHIDIPKVFFTPHHVGSWCTDVIRGYYRVLGHSYTNSTPGHADWVPRSNNDPWVMQVEYPIGKITPGHAGWHPHRNNDHWSCSLRTPVGTMPTPQSCRLSTPAKNATDRHGRAIRCSSVTLQREEHLKMESTAVISNYLLWLNYKPT
jgi:hypothetical protein